MAVMLSKPVAPMGESSKMVDCKKIMKSSTTSEGVEPVNLFLRLWEGKTLCVSDAIVPSSSLGSNRDIINTLEQRVLAYYPHEHVNNFYFVVHGKLLDKDNDTWDIAQTLTNGTTIFVQYRRRGGCFIVSFTVLTIILVAIMGVPCTCGMSLVVVPFLLPLLFILPLFCL